MQRATSTRSKNPTEELKQRTSVLLIVALLATIVRLFLYMVDANGGLALRNAVARMGITVVLLEVSIVMVRFYTVLSVIKLLSARFYTSMRAHEPAYTAVLFVGLGTLTTFLITEVPKRLTTVQSENAALSYLQNRPFELIPVLVEYAALYALHNRIVTPQTSTTLTCTLLIALIVGMHENVRPEPSESSPL